ncbi:MAG: HEAT repeat domain-containing protein [Verrucomicrobiota bacterium]
MTTKRKWIVGGGVALAVLLAVALAPREPRHEGTALSDWLVALDAPATRAQAKEAIQLIGTNALPMIIEELEANDPAWRHKFISWSTNQSWMPVKLSLAEERRMRGVFACQALGPLAKPAIPGLKGVLHEGVDPMCREAAMALNAIGEDGYDVLIDAFGSTNKLAQFQALFAIHFPGCTPQKAREPLMKLIESTDRETSIHKVAQIAHGIATLKPSLSMKHQLAELQSPQLFFRRQGVMTLGKWGKEGAPAIPELEKALRDPEAEVRVEARNALMKIREDVKRAGTGK